MSTSKVLNLLQGRVEDAKKPRSPLGGIFDQPCLLGSGAAEPSAPTSWAPLREGQWGATEKGRQWERVRDTDREKPGQPGKKGHRLMLLAHQDGGDGGHSPCARQPWEDVGATSWLCDCCLKNISKQLTKPPPPPLLHQEGRDPHGRGSGDGHG